MNAFDYIVVGAGTAGCVIARRLVENTDGQVLLLEAGDADQDPRIHATDLGSMTSMWGPGELNWGYQTTAQEPLNGRTIPIAQGKVLGGGSSINAMMHVRGNRRDFDSWAALGNPGWSYPEVLPYFKKSESFAGGSDEYRGRSGPVSVVAYEHPSEASLAFVKAAVELGYPGGDFDYNGAAQDNGAFFYQSARTVGNRRSSTAAAYLTPVADNPRLTIVTRANAARVLMRGDRATGVEYLRDGGLHQAEARAEVVVACGAFSSPRLLMLSGIGDARALRSHGIQIVADLPGVGRNLQDHLLFGVAYESLRELAFPELLAEAGLFARTAGGPDAVPDIQFLFGPVQFVDDEYKTDGPGFTFAPVLTQPRSRGTVTLRSADPRDLAIVDPRYLDDDADLDTCVRAIDLARELAHANAFDGLRGRELAPGDDVTSWPHLAAYVHRSAATVWHPVGTCRMGPGPDAVVDAQLRVHGLTGLRVADASIMPSITCGNTNAATIMIAEKAAHLIANTGSTA